MLDPDDGGRQLVVQYDAEDSQTGQALRCPAAVAAAPPSVSPRRRFPSSCLGLRFLCPHGTSAKPARGATMHTLQQSSEVVAAAAVVDPRLQGPSRSTDRMADCTQKLQATTSAVVES